MSFESPFFCETNVFEQEKLLGASWYSNTLSNMLFGGAIISFLLTLKTIRRSAAKAAKMQHGGCQFQAFCCKKVSLLKICQ